MSARQSPSRTVASDLPSLAAWRGSIADGSVAVGHVALGVSAPSRPPLRLTRRGRVVVLAFFILMASVASAILLATASRAENRERGPAPSVVVQPHDTLWSIATRTAPDRDPYAAMAEIKELNGIRGYVVHPGQKLELPR
jgi:LysM repeat protein